MPAKKRSKQIYEMKYMPVISQLEFVYPILIPLGNDQTPSTYLSDLRPALTSQ